MPCNYKASQPVLEEFRNNLPANGHLNDLQPGELNQLYDLLVWSPPLPHAAGEEERNKRNLLAWITRNYPELRHPTEKMATKSLLDASMQLRVIPKPSGNRASGTFFQSRKVQTASNALDGLMRDNHSSSGITARPQTRSPLPSALPLSKMCGTIDMPMALDTSMAPNREVATNATSSRATKSRSCKSKSLFIQDEDASEDELSLVAHTQTKSRHSPPKLLLTYDISTSEDELLESPSHYQANTLMSIGTQRPVFMDDPEDAADFSDSFEGPNIVGSDIYVNGGASLDDLDDENMTAKATAALPPPSKNATVKQHTNTTTAKLTPASHPLSKNATSLKTVPRQNPNTTRSHTVSSHPTSNNTTPPTDATPPLEHQRISTNTTSQSPVSAQQQNPTPSSTTTKPNEICDALSESLDRNFLELREKCQTKDLHSAINILATMMSIVVLVRDSGFELE